MKNHTPTEREAQIKNLEKYVFCVIEHDVQNAWLYGSYPGQLVILVHMRFLLLFSSS